MVVPDRDRWNDFGYSILAEVGLRQEDSSTTWFQARFALKGISNLFDWATSAYSNTPNRGSPLKTVGLPYACLLVDLKQYSLARRLLGDHLAREMLVQLNDVSILFDDAKTVPNWPDFFGSQVFTLSMIRSSESYLAFRRGANTLAGHEELEGADSRANFSAMLRPPGPSVSFKFNFNNNNLFRGRIAVLVGKNGSGKTTSLTKIAKSLVDRSSRSAKIEPRPEVNQVLAFAHSASLPQFRPKLRTNGSARVRVFSLDPLSRRRNEPSDSQMLVDIFRSHDDRGMRLVHILKEVLDQEFSDLKFIVPVKPLEPDKATVNHDLEDLENLMRARGEQRLLETSGRIDLSRKLQYRARDGSKRSPSLGQLTFTRFLLTALANAGSGSVLLIDEPETFLHPNLISRFMRVLHRILDATGSIAILATHSPFIVREVQSAHVHILQQDSNGVLQVLQPRLQTLGANVANVSSEVFGDDLAEHLYENLVSEAAATGLSFLHLLDQYSAELSTEALLLLRRRVEAREEP